MRHLPCVQGPLREQQRAGRRHLRAQVLALPPRPLRQGAGLQRGPHRPARLLPPLLPLPLQPQPRHPGQQGSADGADQAVQGEWPRDVLFITIFHWSLIFWFFHRDLSEQKHDYYLINTDMMLSFNMNGAEYHNEPLPYYDLLHSVTPDGSD